MMEMTSEEHNFALVSACFFQWQLVISETYFKDANNSIVFGTKNPENHPQS